MVSKVVVQAIQNQYNIVKLKTKTKYCQRKDVTFLPRPVSENYHLCLLKMLLLLKKIHSDY